RGQAAGGAHRALSRHELAPGQAGHARGAARIVLLDPKPGQRRRAAGAAVRARCVDPAAFRAASRRPGARAAGRRLSQPRAPLVRDVSSTPLPPLTQIPPQIAAVEDYEAFAQSRMTPGAFAYISGGAADELTLRENVEAFRRLLLRTRVLRDVDGGDTRLELLGQELAYPILLAPVALQRLAHAEGELATALAAAAMQAPMIVSAQASVSLEDIAASAQGRTSLWLQLYLHGDREFVRALVARAEAAGYRALVVTVDAPVSGARNRAQRAEFALPPGIEAVNLRGMRATTASVARAGQSPVFGSGMLAGAPTWKDIEWLRASTTLPVLLKGIMSPDDAVLAVDAGAAGIVVSNHGGRTLDTQPAT